MKKYSSVYPFLFGLVFLLIGICYNQPMLIAFFGGIPIVISVLLFWHDLKHRTKREKSQTETSPSPPPMVCEACQKSISPEERYPRKISHTFCVACFSKFTSFKVIDTHAYLAPCATAEAHETLSVTVLSDGYLLHYCVVSHSGWDSYKEIPFGFFAASSSTEIANLFNSISYQEKGFGLCEPRKLSNEDILSNHEIQALIDFDQKYSKNPAVRQFFGC